MKFTQAFLAVLLLAVVSVHSCHNPTPQQCGPNEAYNECGPVNQLSCEAKHETSTVDCVPGCFCHDGYIRETPGGTCIPSNECPKKSF